MTTHGEPVVFKFPPAPPPNKPLPPTPSGWEAYVASRHCEHDRCARTHDPVWHCVECARSYCCVCWDLQPPHRPRRGATMYSIHEKTTPLHAETVDSCLNIDPSVAERMHSQDQHTKWVGLARDAEGQFVLEDYGRYDTIWAPLQRGGSDGTPRYPQLVSFVGETDAGKSTLIKLLLAGGTDIRSSPHGHTSPVTGTAANEVEPTSGDIHLYPDPSTFTSTQPMLFVDSEGLRGGGRTPLGARMRWEGGTTPLREDLATSTYVQARPIAWARADQAVDRQDAVHAIYPRLLYAFSDCVVFVLRNPKTVEALGILPVDQASLALAENACSS